jgi:diguanylate cyclase (GGDEF)-like protein
MNYADPLDVVLESVSQGVYLLDAKGRIMLYNNRLCELLDVPKAFFDSFPTLDELNDLQTQRGDFAPDHHGRDTTAAEYYATGHRTPTPPHVLRHTRDGVTLEVVTTLLADGCLVRTFSDVTSFVKAEAARIKANQLLEQTQAIAMIGGWEIDLQTQEVSWSEQVYRIFDTTPADFTPTVKSTSRLFTPSARTIVAASYEGHHHGLVEHDFEIEMLTLTGRPIWVHSRGTTVWENGQAVKRTAILQDITERKKSETRIWEQAHFDALTGLPNRRMLRDRLQQEIKKCHRSGLKVALLTLDLDHFKEVNDTLGHDRGDELLTQAAKRIQDSLREVDTVARMGGDEFTVVVTELRDPTHLSAILPKLLRSLSSAFQLGHEQVFVSASIGVTIYPDDGLEIETLMKNADQALYAAKGAGRNRFSFFTPALQEASLLRAQLTHDLRAALVAQEFRVVYQPIVALATGRIHKAEALLRWQHPTRGMVSPVDFIPVAESSGLIVDIGEWVFAQAMHQAKVWRTRLDPNFQISVNKSPVQFENPNPRHSSWIDQLQADGQDGSSVAVEITESSLLSSSASVSQQLLLLRNEGIQVSLDDFGTGYSSLSYLQRFSIDFVKIDRSFVKDLPNATNMALCQAIIAMAHALGMRVVAEGVETQVQADLLMNAGCDFAQGYLYSRPVSPDEFEALASKHFVIPAVPDLLI